MKTFLAKQEVNEGKITALGAQMVSIVQTTFIGIERLKTDIVECKQFQCHIIQTESLQMKTMPILG